MNHRKPATYKSHGKGLCNYCALPIEGRGSWHPACLHVYKMANWPQYARDIIFKRDHGVCCACGVAAEKWSRETYWCGGSMSRYLWPTEIGQAPDPDHNDRGKVTEIHRVPDWHLDHIVPLIDGGGTDETSMQTLCPTCHKAKTKREAGERAARRRAVS